MESRMARGGRSRHEGRRGSGIRQLPFRQLRNFMPPVAFVPEEDVEKIHRASLKILAEIGVNFLLPEAREILREAGAEVEPGSDRVRFDPALIEERIRTAPSAFTLHARNPEHTLEMGKNWISFAVVASTPNVTDLERGRRAGSFDDYCDLLRLGQSLNIAHMLAGYPVEPIDVPPDLRHLEALGAMARLTDKILYGYSLGRQRILDCIEMTRIVRAISPERLTQEPSITTVVNANSPLQYDKPMLWGMIEMARAGQPVIVTPFTLAGAMAPVTVAGALAQQNAEALAGIAFIQMVSPGAPVMYGGFTSNVDMKSGAPAFGTPEYAKAVLVGGQLARRYGFPYRSSNVNASNHPDAQAVWESEMSIWACVLGHANLVKHALGWLEGGLCTSFEKIVLDAEMLQHMAAFLQPLAVDEETLGLDAIEEVGPGGHFFGTAHTLARYETAFYAPMLSDWRNFQTWSEDGAVDAAWRANRVWKQLLSDYQQPPLDPAIDEELSAFVTRRKAEGGASAD
jgi:trimethylamine--corrinoid protein Co-methyltransferase